MLGAGLRGRSVRCSRLKVSAYFTFPDARTMAAARLSWMGGSLSKAKAGIRLRISAATVRAPSNIPRTSSSGSSACRCMCCMKMPLQLQSAIVQATNDFRKLFLLMSRRLARRWQQAPLTLPATGVPRDYGLENPSDPDLQNEALCRGPGAARC